MGTITVQADCEVDIDDTLDAIDDDALLDEVRSRDLEHALFPHALEGLSIIRSGRIADGVALLERVFIPKWSDHLACQNAYDLAMDRAAHGLV
ncbi:MAG: hypothetical protein ACAH27_05905 [Xanthobacteraceae bacterium]